MRVPRVAALVLLPLLALLAALGSGYDPQVLERPGCGQEHRHGAPQGRLEADADAVAVPGRPDEPAPRPPAPRTGPPPAGPVGPLTRSSPSLRRVGLGLWRPPARCSIWTPDVRRAVRRARLSSHVPRYGDPDPDPG